MILSSLRPAPLEVRGHKVTLLTGSDPAFRSRRSVMPIIEGQVDCGTLLVSGPCRRARLVDRRHR
jgi:hypothetical protein